MLYNSTSIYNATKTYNDGATGVDPGLQLNLNRVIGNTIASGPWVDAQKAANVWASTSTYLDLLGALNYKAGTSGLGLNEVCNLLAGTTNLEADAASQYFS
jgi:hypothetical protein